MTMEDMGYRLQELSFVAKTIVRLSWRNNIVQYIATMVVIIITAIADRVAWQFLKIIC